MSRHRVIKIKQHRNDGRRQGGRRDGPGGQGGDAGCRVPEGGVAPGWEHGQAARHVGGRGVGRETKRKRGPQHDGSHRAIIGDYAAHAGCGHAPRARAAQRKGGGARADGEEEGKGAVGQGPRGGGGRVGAGFSPVHPFKLGHRNPHALRHKQGRRERAERVGREGRETLDVAGGAEGSSHRARGGHPHAHDRRPRQKGHARGDGEAVQEAIHDDHGLNDAHDEQGLATDQGLGDAENGGRQQDLAVPHASPRVRQHLLGEGEGGDDGENEDVGGGGDDAVWGCGGWG